jgi:hypothetical protein
MIGLPCSSGSEPFQFLLEQGLGCDAEKWMNFESYNLHKERLLNRVLQFVNAIEVGVGFKNLVKLVI